MSKGKTLCQKIRDEKDLSKLQELSDIFELWISIYLGFLIIFKWNFGYRKLIASFKIAY